MGNKKTSVRRRKRVINNFTRKCKVARKSIVNPINDNAIKKATVVDVVSILCPTSDIKLEPNDVLDPIATTNEDSGSDKKSEFSYVDDTAKIKSESELDIESLIEVEIEPDPTEVEKQNLIELEIELEPVPKPTEVMKSRKQNLIEFDNICRLCLTGKGSIWIDLFSSQPYENCNDITPSNILEIIEQFTTIKISKDDRLPDKLCSSCFEALKYMHNFRETSLRSKKSLDTIIHNLRMQPVRKKGMVKGIQLKSTKRPILNEAISHDVNRKNGSTEVQCEICGKVFERYQLLQYHLNIHNGVKPFTCTEPFCDKTFYSPQNRKSHINKMHCTDPKFKCDICEKLHTTSTNLKIHRTSHFPPTIPCKICGKLLRNQSSMMKHKASHTERLFKCDDCGKSFQNAYTLRVHQRIHTNEKPFVCCKCAEAFTYKCLLKAHMEKYHPS